jgi:GntR family transcriptional repressor for pyruvate dehydrogenase complex
METITSALYDKRRKTVERSTDLRESAEMHRQIYRAIRAHDPVKAQKLMEQHLRMARMAEGMERRAPRKTTKTDAKPASIH